MTISKRIRSQLFTSSGPATPSTTSAATTGTPDAESTLIRLPLTRPLPGVRKRPSRAKKCLGGAQNGLGWSDEEHERFLRGLETYPTGPWKDVAAFVGTRTTRQVMTHAQKYRQKIARRQRGLQVPVRKPSAVASPSSAPPTAHTTEKEDAMKRCVATVDHTPVEPFPKQIKTEKASFSMELSAATAAFGFSHSTTTSPSSADHVMKDLSSANAMVVAGSSSSYPYSSSFPVVAMITADEFRLVTDELYAETLWMNQFGDDQMSALLMHNDVDDPLALMFQEPASSSSFSWSQRSNNKNVSMDAVFPAHVSMAHASAVHVPYECQL